MALANQNISYNARRNTVTVGPEVNHPVHAAQRFLAQQPTGVIPRRSAPQAAAKPAPNVVTIDPKTGKRIPHDQQVRPGQPAPAVPAPQPVAATPAPAPAPVTAAATAPQPLAFKSTYDFLPRDVTTTPGYEWRMQQAQKELDQRLAASGMTQSGKQIRDAIGLTNTLSGEEYDKARSWAEGDATRYDTQQQQESQRRTDQSNEYFDRLYKLLDLGARQSPQDQAYSGLQEYVKTLQQKGLNKAQIQAQLYKKVGGGGGGAPARPATPFPSGPDYSNIDLLRASSGTASNNGWLNVAGAAIPALIAAFS